MLLFAVSRLAVSTSVFFLCTYVIVLLRWHCCTPGMFLLLCCWHPTEYNIYFLSNTPLPLLTGCSIYSIIYKIKWIMMRSSHNRQSCPLRGFTAACTDRWSSPPPPPPSPLPAPGFHPLSYFTKYQPPLPGCTTYRIYLINWYICFQDFATLKNGFYSFRAQIN